MSRPLLFAAAAIALAVAACGHDSPRPTLHPVSGSLSVGNKPAANAVIAFHPADETLTGVRPHAQVEPDGTFRVGTYADADGAPAGDYIVTVTWDEKTTEKLTGDEVVVDRLKGRYRDPAASRLKVTIKPGSNELPPFRLE